MTKQQLNITESLPMLTWPETKIIKIGSQEIYDIGDRLRFTIKEILPCRGYSGQFGIRDKIIEEAISRAKPLQVTFKERPDVVILMNPIQWKALGKLKNQVGYYSGNPMKFYWYKLSFRNEVTKEKQVESQLNLI